MLRLATPKDRQKVIVATFILNFQKARTALPINAFVQDLWEGALRCVGFRSLHSCLRAHHCCGSSVPDHNSLQEGKQWWT